MLASPLGVGWGGINSQHRVAAYTGDGSSKAPRSTEFMAWGGLQPTLVSHSAPMGPNERPTASSFLWRAVDSTQRFTVHCRAACNSVLSSTQALEKYAKATAEYAKIAGAMSGHIWSEKSAFLCLVFGIQLHVHDRAASGGGVKP